MERLFAVGFFALLASTRPLWIPQLVFPQVPLFGITGNFPQFLEWGLLGLILASLGVVVSFERSIFRRSASLIVGLSTFGLVCIDQHRLQPWVWQFMIVSLVLATADASMARAAWRWLVIGIYGWSAWSKMDHDFCVQHGPFLLDGFCKSIGFVNGTRFWPDDVRYAVAASIPVVELLVALGLSWQPTRRFAVFGAALMHFGLLFALGPLGHGHQPGVLIWNVFFLVQNWLLFWLAREHAGPTVADKAGNSQDGQDSVALARKEAHRLSGSAGASPSLNAVRTGNWIAGFVVLAAMIWPLFEPIGFCDHWPAWAVYAARPERVTVFLNEADLLKLPEKLKRYVGNQPVLGDWYPIRLDRWSLDAVYAPIYPQDRFQVGVTLWLVREFKLNQIRIVIEGPANRWTGKRTVREYIGTESVGKLADSYRCGARPRQ